MNPAQCLKDLENCGIDRFAATSNNLRQLLTTCQDPVEAIKQFQTDNSIQLSSLKPVMKLLDLHGVRRSEYYEMVHNDLTEKVLAKLKSLGEKRTPGNILKLEQQLEKSFKLYRAEAIRPIVLETLRLLPKVADRYLKLIVCDKEFYNLCSVTVRQQIWVKNEDLFLEAVNPVIQSYLDEKQAILLGVDKSPTNFFTCDTTKSRRQWPQIQELVTMIGEQEVLYKRLMDVIRVGYLSTGCVHYCSLRLELLMTIHDLNVDYAVKLDDCHDFAWCLDACLMQKHLDAQQTSKLKTLLAETSRKSHSKVITDLGMIANDPHVIHFLCSMVVKVLKDIASSGAYLPRDHLPLQLLLKLLSLGAWYSTFSGNQESGSIEDLPQQFVNTEILTVFMPALTTMISEDMVRLELQKAPDEVIEEFGQERVPKPVPESVSKFLKTDKICALLWIHYIIDLLPSKRKCHSHLAVLRYVQILPELVDQITIQDPWIHLLIHRIIHTTACDPLISNEEIATSLIVSLLLSSIEKFPSTKLHLLRLCVQLKTNIPEHMLEFSRQKLAEIHESNSTVGNSQVETMFYTQFDKYNAALCDKEQGMVEEGELPISAQNISSKSTQELLLA